MIQKAYLSQASFPLKIQGGLDSRVIFTLKPRHVDMKLFYFLLLLLIALPKVKAQNLVLNPDLEDYSLCPERYGAIDSARHWRTSTNQP